MALTPSGAISMSDINTALNRSSTASISFNDTQVRYLANQDTGSVVFNNLRNKQSTVGTITVGIYDDGKTAIYGFETAFIGSLSSNTFFSDTVYLLYTDINAGGITRILRTSNRPSTPTVTARMIINGVSRTMVRQTSGFEGYQGSGLPTEMITLAMVGGTYTFQFAQT
jgi:hypothetical protein